MPSDSKWLYIKSEAQLYTVGFYSPDGRWHSDSDHETKDDAANRAHFLNGGAEPRKIDGKFSIVGGQIVNRVSGEAIGEDEPLFLLRGRDNRAVDTIRAYRKLCIAECNDLHLAGIQQTLEKFTRFASEHPERMKQPGVTRHLKLEAEDAD